MELGTLYHSYIQTAINLDPHAFFQWLKNKDIKPKTKNYSMEQSLRACVRYNNEIIPLTGHYDFVAGNVLIEFKSNMKSEKYAYFQTNIYEFLINKMRDGLGESPIKFDKYIIGLKPAINLKTKTIYLHKLDIKKLENMKDPEREISNYIKNYYEYLNTKTTK